MFREILQRSKQLEIFRFRPRISYFHHNGHSGSYPTGLPCQNGNSAVVAHIFLKFCRSRAIFEAWRATLGPRATGWEPLIYWFHILKSIRNCLSLDISLQCNIMLTNAVKVNSSARFGSSGLHSAPCHHEDIFFGWSHLDTTPTQAITRHENFRLEKSLFHHSEKA